MKIGIIGFGNFGKFMAKRLSERADVIVADVVDRKQEAMELGLEFFSLDEVARQDVVILATTMNSLEETLHAIKDRVLPGALVMDVCSLKMFSCKLMDEILPENVEIIGTHPLFGPQSNPVSIKGANIFLCDVRSKRLDKVKEFCETLGLNVIVQSAENHDRQAAKSQALTHFIGQVAKGIDLKRVEASTRTFDDLMDIMDIIRNDTPALFEDMQVMNPFALEERRRFIEEAVRLDFSLNEAGKNRDCYN